MNLPPVSSIRPHLLVPVALLSALLVSCLPDGETTAEVEALKKRIGELEERLDVVSSQDNGAVPVHEQVAEVSRRIEELEKIQGEGQDQILSEFRDQNEKLQRMFRGFNQMHDMIQTGQTWAAFGIGYEGHTVARTRHGSFLVELQDQEPDDGGYRLTLRIGNPTGLHIHQFKVYGDYGSPPPDMGQTSNYNQYIKSIDEWEGELKHFEANFLTSLEPALGPSSGWSFRLSDLRICASFASAWSSIARAW